MSNDDLIECGAFHYAQDIGRRTLGGKMTIVLVDDANPRTEERLKECLCGQECYLLSGNGISEA